ncbi:MAG: RimK/LysX family protein [Nanoarchaeota archaeon]
MEIIGLTERVSIRHGDKSFKVRAKIDTGSKYNSINDKLAKKLGLELHKKSINIRAATGYQKRETAFAVLTIKRRKIRTLFTITNREHMKYQVLIGTRTLKRRFLIDPSKKK